MITQLCNKCKKEAVWLDYTQKHYCEIHFLEIIERRIRKHLRINKIINPKKEYFIEPNKENKHLITKLFLKRIFENRLKLTKNKKENKIISDTLDDEAHNLLNYFMKNQDLNDGIKPINVITDLEAQKISEIENIPLKLEPKNHEELTRKDPQILFSMHKSKEFIEERIENLKKIKK